MGSVGQRLSSPLIKNKLSYFSMKTFVKGTQKNCLTETVFFLRTQNISLNN